MIVVASERHSTLSASAAGKAIRAGWRQGAAHHDVDVVPIGGHGVDLLDVIGSGGSRHTVTVTGPDGAPARGEYLLRDDHGIRTAYLAAASVCPAEASSDPGMATSRGVGELMCAALAHQPARLIVALGGTCLNDAGAGMLGALGVSGLRRLRPGGLGLSGCTADDLSDLADVRDQLAGTELVIASHNPAPLLGLGGASATGAVRKGASVHQAQDLESALGHFAHLVHQVLAPGRDVLTATPRRLDRESGAGASGGLGFALGVLGGRRIGTGELSVRCSALADHLADADLLVIGTGVFDRTCLSPSAVSAAAELALQVAAPAIVLAGRAEVGRRDAMGLGVSEVHAVVGPHDGAPTAEQLAACASRVACQWR